jgi:biofilm PGA synthesis lipoprotein PgaB
LTGVWATCFASDRFIAIAYHDITPNRIVADDFTPDEFMKQLAFFKANGYHPVSIGDIEEAAAGRKRLPDNALLLTFDDGYASFYRIVYPALKLFNYPAVLSVVTSWADRRESPEAFYGKKDFMTWDQIKEVANSGLVTVAPHSDNLHKLVTSNPPGNVEPAMTTFVYDKGSKSYETEENFRQRIRSDMQKCLAIFGQRLRIKPTVYTWPYSAYNEIAVDEARKLGFRILLTLDEGAADTARLDRVSRYYAQNMLFWIPSFKEELKRGLVDTSPIRGVQIDLDRMVDPSSYERSDENLGKCLDRLTSLGVNTVFVQAFRRNKDTGRVEALYYQNDALPVAMDFLSHAVNRMKGRGMQTFVWMPPFGFEMPDRKKSGTPPVSGSKHVKGLEKPAAASSLFDAESLSLSHRVFRDMAAYVDFDGVLIQDETPCTERAYFGASRTTNAYVAELVRTIRTYRPTAKIARNVYGEGLDSAGMTHFQEYLDSALQDSDYVIVSAHPDMESKEGRAKAREWTKEVLDRVKSRQKADRVVFRVQAFDRDKNRWVDERVLSDELSRTIAQGAKHVAYYPDGVVEDRPRRDGIASIISGQEFIRGPKDKNLFVRK